MAKNDTLKMITDLHDLRSASINTVLYKLEEIQATIGIALGNPISMAIELPELRIKERLLKELIREMWILNFGEDKDGCR